MTCLGAPALAGLVCAAVAAGAAPAAAQTRSQEFFRARLLDHQRVSAPVKDLLRDGGGFVARRITFSELTGDGRADALVRVHSGGVAGVVALYAFSADTGRPDGALSLVWRAQKLRRAKLRVAQGTLRLVAGRFRDGDAPCCPARRVLTVLRWDPFEHAFEVVERRRIE